MKTSRSNGPTHFLAVPLDEEHAAEIGFYRAWMRERYQCRSGQRTPSHITLIPPFRAGALDGGSLSQDSERLLEALLFHADSIPRAFTAGVAGFGAFGERSLYARVLPDPRWDELRDAVRKALAGDFRLPPPGTAFVPHLTIANRDIPPGAVASALAYLSQQELAFTFDVERVSLYEMHEGLWEEAAGIPLRRL